MVLICITIHEIHNYTTDKPMFLTSIELSFVQLKTKTIPTGCFTEYLKFHSKLLGLFGHITEEMKFWLRSQSFAHYCYLLTWCVARFET